MVIIIRGGVGASVGCMGMEFPRKKPTNCTGMQPEVYVMARDISAERGGVPPNLLS